MKNERQKRILELIEQYEIETQDDLIKYLKDSGFNVTQATVSRDIRELKLTKVLTGRGSYRYTVPAPNDAIPSIKFNRALVSSIIGVDYAVNNIVIKTSPGLATAVARMKDSDAKSRVVILLTDGVNNRGEISPQMAAEIAKTYGVRVYTIGVGKEGMAPYPVMTPWGVEIQNVQVEIDEALLSEIAESTGGRYFRATDNTKLAEIYSEINKMEKARTTVDSFPVYKELFGTYALLALLALMLELLLNWFVIRRLPC